MSVTASLWTVREVYGLTLGYQTMLMHRQKRLQKYNLGGSTVDFMPFLGLHVAGDEIIRNHPRGPHEKGVSVAQATLRLLSSETSHGQHSRHTPLPTLPPEPLTPTTP